MDDKTVLLIAESKIQYCTIKIKYLEEIAIFLKNHGYHVTNKQMEMGYFIAHRNQRENILIHFQKLSNKIIWKSFCSFIGFCMWRIIIGADETQHC